MRGSLDCCGSRALATGVPRGRRPPWVLSGTRHPGRRVGHGLPRWLLGGAARGRTQLGDEALQLLEDLGDVHPTRRRCALRSARLSRARRARATGLPALAAATGLAALPTTARLALLPGVGSRLERVGWRGALGDLPGADGTRARAGRRSTA